MRRQWKRSIGALLCVLCLVCGSAPAQGKLGIGFILGEPTGISWKYRISRANALDGAIGFSPYDRFRIHVDYLWLAYPFRDPNFQLHYGVGAAVGFGRSNAIFNKHGDSFVRTGEMGFGVRTVIGLDYMIPRSPVELFFELAPIFIFAPGTGVGIDVGLGVRFYP